MESTKLSTKPSALPGSRWDDAEFPEKFPFPLNMPLENPVLTVSFLKQIAHSGLNNFDVGLKKFLKSSLLIVISISNTFCFCLSSNRSFLEEIAV